MVPLVTPLVKHNIGKIQPTIDTQDRRAAAYHFWQTQGLRRWHAKACRKQVKPLRKRCNTMSFHPVAHVIDAWRQASGTGEPE
jgi:hypothetical protein